LVLALRVDVGDDHAMTDCLRKWFGIVRWVLAATLVFGTWAMGAEDNWLAAVKEGDIVFSGSKTGQGEAIIAATGSEFTHCGIVFRQGDRMMVLEAVQPVRIVTLEAFMGGPQPTVFAVRRLKTPLGQAAMAKARTWAAAQVGKNYDARFGWGDDKLYCSELVWKVFEKGGVVLCQPKRFRNYNLEHPKVRELIQARYGSIDHLPMTEKVVAPSDLAASALLLEVRAPRNMGSVPAK
jgi:hypothetical protein